MSKQKLSLQEQLLKSGLATSAQAKAVKADKRKQTQQQRKNNVVVVDEAKELALKAQTEKAERDRELNQLRKQQEAQKELAAQVKQLIDLHRQPQDPNGLAYNFNDHNKIKTIYVADQMREQLISGRLAIVKLEAFYDVVLAETAEKIKSRLPECVIVFNEQEKSKEGKQDDPYADFQVPDDLIW